MKYLLVLLSLVSGRLVQTGYIYDKGLGAECLYDEDCLTRNSFCKGNKMCACKIGYQYDPGSDVCFPKEVNLKCSEDYDCSALQNAHCEHGRCQCKREFVPSSTKNFCLPSLKLTSVCEEDIQCLSVMNRSRCDPNTRQCVCERELLMDPNNMQCIEPLKLGQSCISTLDCEWRSDLIGKVWCKPTPSSSLRSCQCMDGFLEQYGTCTSDANSRIAFSLPAIVILLITKFLTN